MRLRISKLDWHWLPALIVVGTCMISFATAGLRENFESAETTWRIAASDAEYRVRQHQRVQSESHWGHGSEQVRVAVGSGTYVFIEHEIDCPRVIAELQASVWVKSGNPGVQMFARVVFPRTLDDAGQPVTALIQGSTYTNVGGWQRLSLEKIPDSVREQARVLRLQLKRDVEVREAYLDRVLLNVYSSPGVVEVYIDDLELEGHVPVPKTKAGPFSPDPHVKQARFEEPTAANIEMRGAVLLVDGQPIFPRVIEHRGESFEFLKRLGFNAIQLSAPPTPWQLAEAERQQIWLVAPPPDVRSGRSISSSHARVLCWRLGAGLDAPQIANTRDMAFAIRRADEQSGRPLLAEADAQMRSYSRIANVMLLSRETLGTSFELASYKDWLKSRQQLLRPGTPTWATVQTQPPAALVQQAHLQGLNFQPAEEPQQVRLMALAAVSAGVRGLIFKSRERLDGEDAASLHRAQVLELVNRELDLIEPWLTVCGHVSPVAVGEAGVQATMFATQHSQLILLTQIADQSQHVISPPKTQGLSLVVPGVAESSDAYVLSPTGLRPLQHRRVTGGIGVALDELGWASAILFTSDPLAYARLAQTVARNRQRTAQLQLATAKEDLRSTKQLLAANPNRVAGEAATTLGLIETNLNQGQRMLAASDANAASIYAQRAEYALSGLRRSLWESATSSGRTLVSPAESSLSLGSSLPWQGQTEGHNQLSSGNMENLSKLVQSGWRNFRREQPGVRSSVELSPVAPNTGQFSLRLQATRGGQEATAQMEQPPIWIRSPEVPTRAGLPYVVQGWVRVDAPLAGTLDGVVIFDTHQGRDLALRVSRTEGWQPFRIRGVTAADRPLAVNIELTGSGEVFVDDVEIFFPATSAAAPEQATAPPHSGPTAQRLRNLIRLPR